ncbi:methionyl-tRNA formyltransferase [Thermovibrio sp.]
MNRLKVVFMGTPDFAVPSLKALKREGYEIPLVITQPDRPAGRGKKLKPPPVKVLAEELGLKVYQPEKVKENRELKEILEEIKPDLIVVAAYGKILPEWLLNLPKYGILNVHASLLPKYRGASPIQWAILNGEDETGVTVMKVIPELDAGPILSQEKVKIEEEDNAKTLHDKLASLGAELLVKTIPEFISGRIKPVPQDEAKATYCPQIRKEMGRVNWKEGSREIFNKVRAFYPWPCAFTSFRGKGIKLIKVRPVEGEGRPGEVIGVKGGLKVATGKGALLIERLKPEGKREISGEEFVRGYRVKVGDSFGN